MTKLICGHCSIKINYISRFGWCDTCMKWRLIVPAVAPTVKHDYVPPTARLLVPVALDYVGRK